MINEHRDKYFQTHQTMSSQVEVKQNDKTCIDICLMIDSVITCGCKIKRCCYCFILVFIIIILTLFIFKCVEIGTERCIIATANTFKGNISAWS